MYIFYSSKYLLNERNNINQVKSYLYFYHVYLIYFYSFKNTLKVMPDFCFLFFSSSFFNQTKHTDKHALKNKCVLQVFINLFNRATKVMQSFLSPNQ